MGINRTGSSVEQNNTPLCKILGVKLNMTKIPKQLKNMDFLGRSLISELRPYY